MMTQEQLIQAFTQQASPPPPTRSGVTIEQFQAHLQQQQASQAAIGQHFGALYQEVAAINTFQKWIVVIQGGVMGLLIIFLVAFFPIWQKSQQSGSVFNSPQGQVIGG